MPFRLCEYAGTWKVLPTIERLADVSTQDLTHGVEITLTTKTGQRRRWRIAANHPLDNIGRYDNAPDGRTPPNARQALRKDNKVWVEIFAPIRQGEDVLIDYGPYYWISGEGYPSKPRSTSSRNGASSCSPHYVPTGPSYCLLPVCE
jgi:hypothetical protein